MAAGQVTGHRYQARRLLAHLGVPVPAALAG